MQNKSIIHRSKIIGGFIAVANDLIRSNDLTLQEKSLLIFILSHSENFAINKQYLYNSLPDTKGTIDTAFKNLQDKGFIHSNKIIGEGGKFTGWHHEVFETPKSEKPTYHKPTVEKPTIGKPTLGNTEVGETDRRQTDSRESGNIIIQNSTNTNLNKTEQDIILENKTDCIKANEKFSLLQCQEIFNHHGQIEQAELFHAHYNSVGWITNGQEIKNLGSLIQKWILNNKNKQNANQGQSTNNQPNKGVNRFDETSDEFLRSVGAI